jgi:hypothetical protein
MVQNLFDVLSKFVGFLNGIIFLLLLLSKSFYHKHRRKHKLQYYDGRLYSKNVLSIPQQ